MSLNINLKEEEETAKESKKKSDSDNSSKNFLKTRQLMLSGEVDEDLAKEVIGKLLLLESISATKAIYIYVDSPGGNVYSGFAIFDVIRFIKPPVKIIGTGLIASAAALILLSAKKQNRFALPNSRYLIHQPLSEMRGVATDLEIYAKEIDRIKGRLNSIIAKETGKTIEEVSKDTERDCWLDAEEALAYGLVSKIITTRKELTAK